MLSDYIPTTDYVVTCRRTGCENGGIAISMEAPVSEPVFQCGRCSHQITDVLQIISEILL